MSTLATGLGLGLILISWVLVIGGGCDSDSDGCVKERVMFVTQGLKQEVSLRPAELDAVLFVCTLCLSLSSEARMVSSLLIDTCSSHHIIVLSRSQRLSDWTSKMTQLLTHKAALWDARRVSVEDNSRRGWHCKPKGPSYL